MAKKMSRTKKALQKRSIKPNKRSTSAAKKGKTRRTAPTPPPCTFICSSGVWWPQGCSTVSGYYCPETVPPRRGGKREATACSDGSPTTVARSSLPARLRKDFDYFTEYRFEKKTKITPAQFYMIGGKVPTQNTSDPTDYCAPTFDKFTGKKDKDAAKLKKIQQALEDSGLSGTILIEWNASIHECEVNKHDPAHKNNES